MKRKFQWYQFPKCLDIVMFEKNFMVALQPIPYCLPGWDLISIHYPLFITSDDVFGLIKLALQKLNLD